MLSKTSIASLLVLASASLAPPALAGPCAQGTCESAWKTAEKGKADDAMTFARD